MCSCNIVLFMSVINFRLTCWNLNNFSENKIVCLNAEALIMNVVTLQGTVWLSHLSSNVVVHLHSTYLVNLPAFLAKKNFKVDIYYVMNELQQILLNLQQCTYWSTVVLCVSPDNRKLVSCGNDGFLKIFDVNTGSEVFAKNSSQQLKWVVSIICMLKYHNLEYYMMTADDVCTF